MFQHKACRQTWLTDPCPIPYPTASSFLLSIMYTCILMQRKLDIILQHSKWLLHPRVAGAIQLEIQYILVIVSFTSLIMARSKSRTASL